MEYINPAVGYISDVIILNFTGPQVKTMAHIRRNLDDICRPLDADKRPTPVLNHSCQ